MELHKEWIEVLLKKKANDESVQKVISTDYSNCAGDGENYASELKRVTMKVVLGSGEISQKSLIVKRVPDKQLEGTFARDYPLFQTETAVYSNVLPEMERLMKRKGDTRENIWCQCIGHINHDLLAFEDLQEKGYKLADRSNGLDLTHALLVLRNLGRYHAMTYILISEGKVPLEKFGDYILCCNDETMNKITVSGFVNLIDVMRTTWSEDWKEVAEKLDKRKKGLLGEIQGLLRKGSKMFQVLNHGDSWSNNLMFKYDLDTNEPISMMFLDFQGSHYNSYCWDLIYFIFTSVRRKVRMEHYDDLLEAYRNSIKITLELMGSDSGVVPTLSDIKEDIRVYDPYKLMISACLTPVMLAPPEDKWDFSVISEGTDNDDKVNRKMYLNEKYKEAIQCDLNYYKSIGII